MWHVTHAICAGLAAISARNGYKMCAFVNFLLLNRLKSNGVSHYVAASRPPPSPPSRINARAVPSRRPRICREGRWKETTPTAGGGAAGVVCGTGNRGRKAVASRSERAWGESVRLRIPEGASAGCKADPTTTNAAVERRLCCCRRAGYSCRHVLAACLWVYIRYI